MAMTNQNFRVEQTEDGPFLAVKLADIAIRQPGVVYCDARKGHRIPRPEARS